jgi:hypothetical protein
MRQKAIAHCTEVSPILVNKSLTFSREYLSNILILVPKSAFPGYILERSSDLILHPIVLSHCHLLTSSYLLPFSVLVLSLSLYSSISFV